MLALRWCDLRDDQSLRHVVFARQAHARTREIRPTKTRVVEVSPEHPAVRAELEAWWAAWPSEYGREARPEDLVVPARADPGRPWGTAGGAGGPLWQQDVDRAWKMHLKALGLPTHRTHDWRHTFASLCADAGMREHVAARWTHALGKRDARLLYSVPSWETQCPEMLHLHVAFGAPAGVSVPDSCTA